MNSNTKRAMRYAGRKTFTFSKKIALKIISWFGLPAIIISLIVAVILIGMTSQTSKEISALGLLNSDGDVSNHTSIRSGKATYVGVDDKDTPLSKAVLAQTNRYSDRRNPYFGQYKNLCLKFVGDMYENAGIKHTRLCCAYRHSVTFGRKDGKIPKGAIVYSGYKPDGTFYENFHTSGCFCSTCHHWAGHVGIYVGDGVIVGSQVPYAMSLDSWIETYGYGGYSF